MLRYLSVMVALLLFGCQPYLKQPTSHPAPQVRVLLTNISIIDSIRFTGSFLLHSEEADYELGKQNALIYLSVSAGGFRLFNQNRIFTFRNGDIITLKPKLPGNSFSFRGNQYFGNISLRKEKDTELSFINVLDLETYLNGVVPSEMPSSKPGYLEALKAQAICARTYALKKMVSRKNEPFDLFADVWDQVYRGLSAETALASQAVHATAGDVLMFNDSLATVFYHSTCGGLTESVQSVWPGYNYPYLQSSKDIIGSEFACTVSPLYRWQRSFSLSDLDSVFNLKYHKSFLKQTVKDTTSLTLKTQVLSRTPQGRVQQMRISYGDTVVTLQGYDIRRFFSTQKEGDLRSRFFSIFSTDSAITIRGGGYGHGVGMCQWGALNMSEKGFKYYDILVNKYFKGTYLKKVY